MKSLCRFLLLKSFQLLLHENIRQIACADECRHRESADVRREMLRVVCEMLIFKHKLGGTAHNGGRHNHNIDFGYLSIGSRLENLSFRLQQLEQFGADFRRNGIKRRNSELASVFVDQHVLIDIRTDSNQKFRKHNRIDLYRGIATLEMLYQTRVKRMLTIKKRNERRGIKKASPR